MAELLTPYNTPLSQAQMEVNAPIIASYLLSKGWTMQAICGALGNWESECKLNPNDPQTDAAGFPSSASSRSGGFGFAQWTPCGSKILWYCEQKGLTPTQGDNNPAADLALQIEYHEYECTQGYQGTGSKTWFSNKGYSYTWEEYKQSTDDPAELARAYYWQYERSAAGTPGPRPAQAVAWYEFLTGIDLPDVPTPGPGATRSGLRALDLILYTRRRYKGFVV